MFCKTYGRGDDAYLALHGWAGDHREFAAIAARLPDGAQWTSCDLPGYGQTPPPAEWSMASIMDQIEDGLGALLDGGRRMTLVGFCSGVVLALLLARRRPACFKRIVMIDPFAFVPWYFRIFTLGSFGEHAYAATFESATGRWITNRILAAMQTSDADFTAAFLSVDHAVTQNYLRLFTRLAADEVFSGLPMEGDIVLGENTFGAVRKSAAAIHAVWPGTAVHTLRRTGHLPLVKGAPALRRIIFREPFEREGQPRETHL